MINFDVDKKYIIWANNDEGILENNHCSPSEIYSEDSEKYIEELLSKRLNYINPKKQLELGIVNDKIICPEKMKLMQKYSNNLSACVFYDSAEKLIEREWGRPIFYGLWGH